MSNLNSELSEFYDDFCFYYPSFAEKAIDYFMVGPWEMVVVIDDGDKIFQVIFDCCFKNYRPFPVCDPLDVTEAECKSWIQNEIDRRISYSGKSYEEIAEEVGVTRTMLSRWCNGHAWPTLYNAYRLSRVLGCTVDCFFAWDIADVHHGPQNNPEPRN